MEDEGDKDESNSITNQRKLIHEYLNRDEELRTGEVLEFCDDGYSGTNMKRPGMQKLIKEIKSGKITCIIVKDMSRFSRDYIEMGTYLNRIFPFLGVRFIAVNDHYDSRKNTGNSIGIDTAFRTLLYDMYSKDISIKVKTSIENKCAGGEYVFGQTPFGYRKSSEIKNSVIIDDNEARLVRYIFSLALQGKSSTRIAEQLYSENVPSITQIRYPRREYRDRKVRSWSTAAIRNILNNRFYLGEMTYKRNGGKVIKNHHEAIIPEEIFEKVASFCKRNSARHSNEKHPLTGKLFCGGCGYALVYKKTHCRCFECTKHSILKIPDCCTYINATMLERAILLMLNSEFMLYGDKNKFTARKQTYLDSCRSFMNNGLKKILTEKKKLRAEMDYLYEEYALGKLEKKDYQKKTEELTERISGLLQKEKDTEKKLNDLRKDFEKPGQNLFIDSLTNPVADVFINKIYVHKNKLIEIEWNFRAE